MTIFVKILMEMKRLSLLCGAALLVGWLSVGCGGQAKADYKALIANGWQLKEIIAADSSYTIMPERPVTVVFSDSSTVSGFAGCNGFFGSFSTIGQNEIIIEPTGRTMSLCPDIEFEDKFMALLEQVTSYSVLKGELSLNDTENGMTLLFDPQPKERMK